MSVNSNYFSNTEVNAIRARALQITSNITIAREVGVSPKTIYNIRNAKRYANVPLPQIRKFAQYQVFADGRVLSLKTKAFLTPSKGSVKLTAKNGKRVTVSVKDLIQTALTA